MLISPEILIAESGSGFGGSAKYLSGLLSLLDRRRYCVQVVAAEEGPFIRQIRQQGVPVTLRPSWRFPWGKFEGLGRLWFLMGAFLQLTVVVPRIFIWLKRHRIQLVHLNNEILSHLPLLLAARWAGCRTLCHLHGWRQLTTTEQWAARYVNQFISVTQAGSRFYRDQLWGREVLAIPNGLISNGVYPLNGQARALVRHELGVEDQDLLVVSLGRLVPEKGHQVFLQALAKTIRQQPRLRGLVVGHDPSSDLQYRRQLEELVCELGIMDKVRFLPWQENVASLYLACDLVVQASQKPESFGLVVLEAMAAGRPVVASRVGGIPDLVMDGETGLLVEPGDVNELSQAIRRLVEDRKLAGFLVQQAQQRVKSSFTMERNATQITAVYERLLQEEFTRS